MDRSENGPEQDVDISNVFRHYHHLDTCDTHILMQVGGETHRFQRDICITDRLAL
jgi:hypothetical protein